MEKQRLLGSLKIFSDKHNLLEWRGINGLHPHRNFFWRERKGKNKNPKFDLYYLPNPIQ